MRVRQFVYYGERKVLIPIRRLPVGFPKLGFDVLDFALQVSAGQCFLDIYGLFSIPRTDNTREQRRQRVRDTEQRPTKDTTELYLVSYLFPSRSLLSAPSFGDLGNCDQSIAGVLSR